MLACLTGCLGRCKDTQRQHGSPGRAAAWPPASPLPPAADPLPLAADSLAFAVPPSLDAALDVLAAQHPASPKAVHVDAAGGDVTETAVACAAGLRSYRQRLAPERRRRERRRLGREQADHLRTLEHLGRGLKVPPAPAALQPNSRCAEDGGPTKQPQQQPAQQPSQHVQVLPSFKLAPVFHSGGAEARTQLVPLHRSRQAPASPCGAGAALHSTARHSMAAVPADAAQPPSSAGSISMQSATSRLACEDAAASSGSRTGAASAAPLLRHPDRDGGSAASLAASSLTPAATSVAACAGGSTPAAWADRQDGTSPSAAWTACSRGLSGSAAWREDLIELELVDMAGTCVERLPPQPVLLPTARHAARPSPDAEEAVPAQTTPSFLAFVMGGAQTGSLASGSSGSSGTSSGHNSAATSRLAASSSFAGASTAAVTSPGAACERSRGTGSSAQAAGLSADSSQAALLEGPEAHSSSSPCSGSGGSQANNGAGAASVSASAGAALSAGPAGALLSSFKRVPPGRLQQRAAPGHPAAKQPVVGQQAAAGKQGASTHLVAVVASQLAVGVDAEDVLPRRAAALAGRRRADENQPVLA